MTSSVLRDGRTGDCQDGRLQYAPKTSDLTVSLPGRLSSGPVPHRITRIPIRQTRRDRYTPSICHDYCHDPGPSAN